MKSYTWSPEHTLEEQKNGAYFERNMMVLLMAISMSAYTMPESGSPAAGWYKHQGEGFEGWSRVISLYGGAATFHVPDDFELGNLPEIAPNWDGHSTSEKWELIMGMCGIVDTNKRNEE